jgi:hypothetical protein
MYQDPRNPFSATSATDSTKDTAQRIFVTQSARADPGNAKDDTHLGKLTNFVVQ